MVDASEGEFAGNDTVSYRDGKNGVVGDGVYDGDCVVEDSLVFFVLGKKVKMVLEARSGGDYVIGGVAEVGEDGRVVAFLMGGIDTVIADAAVLLNVNLIAKPVGEGTVAMVFGGIKGVDPEIVVL